MKIFFIVFAVLCFTFSAYGNDVVFKTPLYQFSQDKSCEVVLNKNIPSGFGIEEGPNHAFLETPNLNKMEKVWPELTSRLSRTFGKEPILKNYLLFMDPEYSKIPMIQSVLRSIARSTPEQLIEDLNMDSANKTDSENLYKEVLAQAAQMEQSILNLLPPKEVEQMNLVTAVALRFNQYQKRSSSENHFDDLGGYIDVQAPYINSFFTFAAGTEILPEFTIDPKPDSEWISARPGFQTIITGAGRTAYSGIPTKFSSTARAVLHLPNGIRPSYHRAPNDIAEGYPPRVLLFVAVFATGKK